MRRYETIVIIDPDVTEKEREVIFERSQKIIEEGKGKVIELDKWGSKKLAYLVRKKSTGFYLRIDFCCDNNEVIKKLETSFKHDEQVMKFLTVKLSDNFDVNDIDNIVKKAKEEESGTEEVTSTTETKEEVKEEGN